MFLTGVTVFALTSATAGLAASPEMLIASRVAAGLRRRADDARDALDHHQCLPGSGARPRDRHLGGCLRAGALVRPAGRRLSGRARLLAGDLLHQPPGRAIAITATLFAVRESRDRTIARVVDLPGVATLTLSLTSLVLALIEGNAWGWGSPAIVALFVGGALGLVAFTFVERNVRAPMVEFEFFANRNFLGATAVAFIISFAMLGTFFFMAIYMQDVLGYSALEAGVASSRPPC